MKRKHDGMTFLLLFAFLIGLSLLLYPTVSDYINSLHQSRAINEYTEHIAGLDQSIYEKLWADADRYNAALPGEGPHELTGEERAEYQTLLNVSGNGVMGYIEIPKIKCSLPIYHGTDQDVLEIAVGHLEGTSLPAGGESTHAVLSGHRGLPSARLFTDLDQLVEGDTFLLQILDKTLTYEVDRVLIVEPYEIEELQVTEGKDYCTLVTCTPYGINTQRMLVRGHRIENQNAVKKVRVSADAMQIEPVIIAPLVAAPMLCGLLAVLLIKTRKSKNHKEDGA